MKRITYISKLKAKLSFSEIEKLGKSFEKNNRTKNITGTLIYFNNLFFQIIEGNEKDIDTLYHKIKGDHRHEDVLALKLENEISTRYFPDWSMKLTNLDQKTDEFTLPIKLLLQALIDSHMVIEKYTQPSVLKIISNGLNPVMIKPKEVERIVVFGDILSYSTLAEQLNIEEVFLLINSYFEICTRIITKKGGEVNKFIGDGFMAYFNADHADLALEACVEILEELNLLRNTASATSPLSLLYSGYGIDKGIVIEGNMGSEIKMDYTIIGDAVNTAARLEDHTRVVEKSIVLSELVKTSCTKKWDFIRLGQFYLKGQREHTAVYSINHKLVDNFKDKENLTTRIVDFAKKFNKV